MDAHSSLGTPMARSKSEEASVAGGLLIGLGDDQITPDRPMPSEYGLAGAPAYLSVSWFF